jgi:hypothetical protein
MQDSLRTVAVWRNGQSLHYKQIPKTAFYESNTYRMKTAQFPGKQR